MKYTYDANGNVVSDTRSGIAFTIYDISNLPVAMYTTAGVSQIYAYDVNGSRVRKYASNGTDTYYLNDATGRTEVVQKGTANSVYTYNIQGAGTIGQVLRNGATVRRYYYLRDHLGTVRMLVDTSGAVDSYTDVYPYGMQMPGRNSTASGDTRYKYTGKERDTETGWDYFGARYYDSRIGRWLAVDPMAGKYAGWSAYNSMLNNPIGFVDPEGQWVVRYDSSGNIVSAVAQDNDNLEGLYSQLGMTADDFAKKYNIDDIADYEVVGGQTSFDISSFVFKNQGFDASSVGDANCMSFVLNASGLLIPQAVTVSINGNNVLLPAEESRVVSNSFGSYLQTSFGLSAVSSAQTGDIAVLTADYNGVSNCSVHSAIYLLTDNGGNRNFISRNGVGQPVTVSTMTQYRMLYGGWGSPISSVSFYRRTR